MTPYLQDADFTLHLGDVLDVLPALEAGSVHCVVTSPPYWGLRDYGTDGQLGLEATPELYVARMVEVFREVRRVLRADGTCWLNLGDSYVGTGSKGDWTDPKYRDGRNGQKEALNTKVVGLKSKDLVGIPWRVAFALQADGWYLRSDIIWAKPNPMPESVTDRPTKAHEYVFLLSKGPRYFFDAEAVREPHADTIWSKAIGTAVAIESRPLKGDEGRVWANNRREYNPAGRNVRSVWEIATQPYPDAHFATYPEELVRRCILAGTSERGCCPKCGKPWERETERGESDYSRLKGDRDWRDLAEISVAQGKGVRPGQSENKATHANHTMTEAGTVPSLRPRSSLTLGWSPGCDCGLSEAGTEGSHGEIESDSKIESPASESPQPIPCTVLDPFMGSGTTALVARKHGRRSIGIELNPAYAELCARRLQQQSLFSETAA